MKAVKNVKLNLLPDSVRLELKTSRYKKINTAMLTILAIAWVLTSGGIFVANYVATKRLEQAQTSYSRTQNQLTSMLPLIQSIGDIKYSARLVADILSLRFEYAKAYRNIRDVFPSEVTLDDVTLKQPKYFLIRAKASNNLAMQKMEGVLTEIEKGKKSSFLSAKIASLNRDKTGWTVDMEVRLK